MDLIISLFKGLYMSFLKGEFKSLKKELEHLLNNNLVFKTRLLTQKEACKYLNLSAGTMNVLVNKQEIHPVIQPSLDGKKTRPKYELKDLDRYIDKYRLKPIKRYEPNK